MPRPQRQKSPGEQLDALRLFYTGLARQHGSLVHARRKALGLTLEQLAGLVGVPMQTLSKVERGDITPRPYLQAAIALHLHAEPGELFPAPTRTDLVRQVVA